MEIIQDKKVVVLVGGVGGAKLAYGLARIVPPENLTIIVNVADDFWHYGLRICPDSDTIMYTLAGVVDPINGWGIADDTVHALGMLKRYGDEAWFRLSDRDFATHILRTHRLQQGQRLTQITQQLSRQLGVQCALLPVTDHPVATLVDTVEYGELEFQVYFVKHRWQPRVKAVRYEGAANATITPEVHQAMTQADVILFGPSNPWLSLEPILATPGMRELLRTAHVPRAAVTPIVSGRAIKGPAAKIMQELGLEVSARTVADFYGDVITHFVIDERDVSDFNLDVMKNLRKGNLSVMKFDTIMTKDEDKVRLAQEILTALL